MRFLFRLSGSSSRVAMPFEVVCACGQRHHGQRQAKWQVVRCKQCQRELFVLPRSPLPPVAPPGGASQSGLLDSMTGPRGKAWVGPVLVGLASLLVAGLVFIYCYGWIVPTQHAGSAATSVELKQLLRAGQEALEDEDYKKARLELNQAQAILASQPQALPSKERRQLLRLVRQAALLADWLGEPLEQVLSRIVRLNEAEWQTVADGYRGKTVVLDLELRRDAAGQYHTKSNWAGGQLNVRLDVQNVVVLKYLPLEEPQRVLLAARLAEIRRAGPEVCLIRLESESGTLLTDTRSASFGFPLQPPVLQQILKQQQRWAEQIP